MSPHTLLAHRRLSVAAIVPSLALAASACGGGQAASTQPTAAAAQTVNVRTVPGAGSVLVDARGNPLYSPAQEAHGMAPCPGACASVWVPLTVRSGSHPAGAAPLAGKLGTLRRPDGATQVTYRGAPLYSFALDRTP